MVVERASIHPMWAMEEKARRGRSWVCARPLMAPVSALRALRRRRGVVMVAGKSALNRMSRGVSFCHVRRIVAENQFNEANVEGNH